MYDSEDVACGDSRLKKTYGETERESKVPVAIVVVAGINQMMRAGTVGMPGCGGSREETRHLYEFSFLA